MEDVKINWYRTKIDGRTMRELTSASDWRGSAHALAFLAMVVASGAFAYYATFHLPWPWIVIAFMLHGTTTGLTSPTAACHELTHGTAFRTRWLNNVFLYAFAFISWSNPIHFWASHKRHHLYTIHWPWDREVVLPGGPIRWRFILQLTTVFWTFIYNFLLKGHIRYSLGKLQGEWENIIFPESDMATRRAAFNWSRVLVFGHAALTLVFIYYRQWILIPIVVFPFYFQLLAWMFVMTQHTGLQSRVPDFRRCCRTVIFGPVFRFLYWHMNYHTEHHMFPGVPFYKLHKVHLLVLADGGAPPCQGLIAALKEIRMIQRKQTEQPGMAFDQFSRGKEPIFVPQEGSGPRPAIAA